MGDLHSASHLLSSSWSTHEDLEKLKENNLGFDLIRGRCIIDVAASIATWALNMKASDYKSYPPVDILDPQNLDSPDSGGRLLATSVDQPEQKPHIDFFHHFKTLRIHLHSPLHSQGLLT